MKSTNPAAGGTEVSEQLKFLRNVIESAKTGNEAAVDLLRRICVTAAEQAPVYDLIAVGQCLFHLGEEAARANIAEN